MIIYIMLNMVWKIEGDNEVAVMTRAKDVQDQYARWNKIEVVRKNQQRGSKWKKSIGGGME